MGDGMPLIPRGPKGPRPNHRWTGAVLSLENPDGSYDDGVDLSGPPGASTAEAQAAAAASDASATAAATSATQAGSQAAAATAQAAAAAGSAGVFLAPPTGRATLTSGVPVTTADVVGATSLYYTPCIGNVIPIFNGTAFVSTAFAELALTLDDQSAHAGYHQAGKNFDLFVVKDGSTIRLGTGPAWTSDTGRGTGAGTTEVEFFGGVWVNKNALALRFGSSNANTLAVPVRQATYVGTIRTTADGVTEDSKVKRFLFNAYNATRRNMARVESTSYWTTTAGMSPRTANGNLANCLQMILGLPGVCVEAFCCLTGHSTSGSFEAASTFIQIDAIPNNYSPDPAPVNFQMASDGLINSGFDRYSGYPGLGYHTLFWIERVTTTSVVFHGAPDDSGISGGFLG